MVAAGRTYNSLWGTMEPATRIERVTRHRFGSETCLTDSYKGGLS